MTEALNDLQSAVVETAIEASTNVMAGAGTGKTRVLVERYLRLVRVEGVPPGRILALTFTLKAADEMRRRVYDAVREDADMVRELDSAWIMNFHSFGYRLIRDNAPAFGADPGAAVATNADIARIKRLLKTRYLAGKIPDATADFAGEVPSPNRLGTLFDKMIKIVEKCRNEMLEPEKLREMCTGDDHEGYKRFVDTVVAVHHAFESELRRRGLIDFNDMITIAARGLGDNPRLLARYRDQFAHILVDEFQDTSTAQYDLLRRLSKGEFANVTVVGDEKQAIYRWRDAHVENIRMFPGTVKPLTTNYRSRQCVLDLAHAFIIRDPAFQAALDTPLVAHRGDPSTPIVLFHPDDGEGRRRSDQEAAALAVWVRHLAEGVPLDGARQLTTGDRVEYEDVTVLLRTLKRSSGLPEIEAEFRACGIPYTIVGGANAAESQALELLHAILSLLLPGYNLPQLLTALEAPPFRVDDAGLFELLGRDNTRAQVADELLSAEVVKRITDPAITARVSALARLLERLAASRARGDFHRFLAEALDWTPFYHRLYAEGATHRAAQDVTAELFGIAADLERRGDLNLSAFLEQLRTIIDERSFGVDKDLGLPPGRVRIMTIHQAKGLEFRAVAVAGIRGSGQRGDGFFVSKKTGLYLKEYEHWNRLYNKSPEYAEEKRYAEQEKRCLLYVAMTRAKDYLFVSTPHPKGIEGRRPTLFADLLECAASPDIDGVVWRAAPKVGASASVAAAREPGAAIPGDDDTVATWRRDGRAAALVGSAGDDRTRSVTWRALLAHAICPLRYRFGYLAGVGEQWDPGREWRANVRSTIAGVDPSVLGGVVHRVLYEIGSRGVETSEKITGTIERAVAEAGIEPAVRETEAARVGRLVEVYRNGVEPPSASSLLETPFQTRRGRVLLQGVCDRVDETHVGLVVTDYKIGKKSNDYRFQVSAYAWALGRATGKEVSTRICYLREEGVEFDETAAAGIDSAVDALDRSFAAGSFGPTPGPACRSCPYAGVCRFAAPG